MKKVLRYHRCCFNTIKIPKKCRQTVIPSLACRIEDCYETLELLKWSKMSFCESAENRLQWECYPILHNRRLSRKIFSNSSKNSSCKRWWKEILKSNLDNMHWPKVPKQGSIMCSKAKHNLSQKWPFDSLWQGYPSLTQQVLLCSAV